MKKIHWFTDKEIKSNCQKGVVLEIFNKEIIKQISKVLKIQEGETIIFKNGFCAYEVEILSISNEKISTIVINKLEKNKENKISLVFCIPKKDKFELILEKCTEIGITDFFPVVSDRTIKTNINFDRALKIIEEASEQSQRVDTPTLHKISKLDDVLGELEPIVFDIEGKQINSKELKEKNTFLVGPEGGFSQRELDLFKQKKLKIYKLGDTILKTETATIVISGLMLNYK